MSNPLIVALVSAVSGAVLGGLITFLVAERQTRVMRAQLDAAWKQAQLMEDQIEAARQDARLSLLQPMIKEWSKMLSRAALDTPSDYITSLPTLRQFSMQFSGESAEKLWNIVGTYQSMLGRYAMGDGIGHKWPGTVSREKMEQMRQETIQRINAIIGIPL